MYPLAAMNRNWKSMVELPSNMELAQDEEEETQEEGPEPSTSRTRSCVSDPSRINQVKDTETDNDSENSDFCVEDEEHEEEEDTEQGERWKIDLGGQYVQCRAAREARTEQEVTDISTERVEGPLESVIVQKKKMASVGAMNEVLDDDITDCFHGARFTKNGRPVNQYLSSSFDPATLRCITCTKEHSIGGDGECFVLSDQNYFATVPGKAGKKCMNIVRIENASLTELAETLIEIMENKKMSPGTCILLGSLSHLARVGASIYAEEWRAVVHMLNNRWGGGSHLPPYSHCSVHH